MDKVDKSDFIDHLNGDLSTEFQSIVQYVQHSATVKGAELGLPDVAEALRPLLTQTQDHVIDLREALGR